MNNIEKNINEIVKETKDLTEVPEYTIKLRNGEEYNVPPFGFKDDMNVVRWLGDVLRENKPLLKAATQVLSSNIDSKEKSQIIISSVLEGLPDLVMAFPDTLIKLVMIVLKKDEDWVNDNCDLAEVVDFLPPFLEQKCSLPALAEKISEWFSLLMDRLPEIEEGM